MQIYQAVEEAKGHLLYVVGHFVRRDGALPRYLHGTCVETQHLIPNVMCVKSAPLETTLRPVRTHRSGIRTGCTGNTTNLLCFHGALLGK